MIFRGLDLTSPINRLKAGYAAMCVNVRAYFVGGFQLRNLLTAPILSVGTAINSLARLNDSTPAGPSSGYTIIVSAGTNLFNNATQVGSGFSGNPVSIKPFRPNTSVQPWAYIGDSSQGVTLATKSLYSGLPVSFPCFGMVKVRSDGLAYKMGVKEPQLAPVVSTQNTSATVTGTLLATDIPWTNYAGANTNFNYGESNGYPKPSPDGTAPFVVTVKNATTITITSLTGTATINGGAAAPTNSGPATSASTNPGHYIQIAGTGGTPATASVVVGAFIDGTGNVMPIGVAPLFIPSVVDVGGSIGTAIQIPAGAVNFQIGINSTGNTFSANSGSFTIAITVTTDALSPVLGLVGTLNLYYWGDSPTAGPVASYIWRNPGDSGGGTNRSTSNAVGSLAGNSFIFDATFTAGIPALPGIGNGTTPMLWSQLNANESVSSTISVSPSQNSNFNFCLCGSLYVPQAGSYTFVLTSKDDCLIGLEGAILVSASQSGSGEGSGVSLSGFGQTISVVKGYPLFPRQNYTNGNDNSYARTTIVASYAAAGVYGIELDYDYFYRAQRILLLSASPTPGATPGIIPPGPANQRQQVQYRYKYRSSATGALSNPSPESGAITLPVSSSVITSLWSPDPQIDLVDYYRMDSATTSFTYVATGPNDNLGGGGTNTPITDSLGDLDLGSQLLDYDDFEPFPSIDLPQKGTCTVSGGVITWVSGGSIGGAETRFNLRWLAGTVILIGSPTSLAYSLIARPTSTTTVVIPGVPDAGQPVQYTIAEPILAAQPLPYLWGPSDNIPFVCGCGDPLRPGTMYWCKGNNLDSAPDTNQLDLTSPSEALVNGCYSGGKGIVFTTERAIAVLPNFYNALATVTGTEGQTWSVQSTGITRGLFIPRCLAVSGSGTIFFRVNDGWHASPGGGASQSITDETLYPLFPHEESTPQPITRNGITIYPPDDTQPQKQRASMVGAYLYWDYLGTDGNFHTLVFDEAAKGWVLDGNTPQVTARASNDAMSVQGVLVGCAEGSVRQLSSTSSAVEMAAATVLSGAIGGKGYMHVGQIVIEYSSLATVNLQGLAADEGNGSYGFAPITLPSTGGAITKYFVRPTPNKFKLMWFQFSSADPSWQLYLDGTVALGKSWATMEAYHPFTMFGGSHAPAGIASSVSGGEG